MEHVYIFGAAYRMFTYHWVHPYQYIAVVCLFYATMTALLAQRIAKGKYWIFLCIAIVVCAPLVASPFGGMLWHLHDMLAGFFPDNAIGKLWKGFFEGAEIGWLIVLLSVPYNIVCAFMGIIGTRWLARRLYQDNE